MNEVILSVRDLKTHFNTDDGIVKAVDGISFELRKGETLGIVGESGCGKSVTNLSVMRLIPSPPGKIVGGEILLDGKSVLAMSESELRTVRGGRVSMIFQDPMTCLNPFLRISTQLVETFQLHQGLDRADAKAKAVAMLGMVGIPNPERRIDAYPHQFSGGMRQRVMIAMALSCNPEILIADEPSTALDVTIQAQILEIIKELTVRLGTAVILITHDLGVVSGMCDRIIVMYAGRIVETAATADLFRNPAHPYTRGLIHSIPRLDRATKERLFSIKGLPPSLINIPECCPFHPRCESAMEICSRKYPDEKDLGDGHKVCCWLYLDGASARAGFEPAESSSTRSPSAGSKMAEANETLLQLRGLKMHFPIEQGAIFRRVVGHVRAVDGIDFEIRKGETLGLVGESGCGKSTTARAIAQLYRPTAGEILFEDRDLCRLNKRELLEARMHMQMIFQDPYASLNPRMTVGDIVSEPMTIYARRGLLTMSRSDIRKRAEDLLGRVGLSRHFVNRFPHEFSGGQKQRIGIARSLALNPKLILADEPVSALDVSIQAQILNLLHDLQDEFSLTYLFIAHDLAVIRHISTRVAVMYLGVIVEIAESSALYGAPLHPYTKALLSAVPIPDPEIEKSRKRIILEGDVPSPDRERHGCYFYDRCSQRMDVCKVNIPRLTETTSGHRVACFLYFNP